jgi:sugar (pentulose or hexulose) kinase
MAEKLVISIDSSTTACKAIAWNRLGSAVAEGRASYVLHQPQPGWHEQDPDDWWRGACKAIRECVSQIDVSQVDALGITHQRESFAALDAAGQPLRNAILWSDERSKGQVAWLEREFGRDVLHRLTGKPPSMTQSLPKVVWLIQNEPELIARTRTFVDVHAFLVNRLTGKRRTSLASADPMGMVDMLNHRWAGDLIQTLGLQIDQFYELAPPGSVIGYVQADGAAATDLPVGLPVVAGAGDGQCAGLGAGLAADSGGSGRAYLNLGTGIASGALSEEYLCDRAFRTLYAPLAGSFFIEHVLRGGVFTLSWFIDKFAADLRTSGLPLSPEEILETAAAKLKPGAQGLMVVPYWNSVMSPYWDPLASGITIGWTGAHGREHFYRAIMEGIAFEQRLVGDAMMAATGQHFSEYVTMGGGSRSRLWRQIIADGTGVPVVCSSSTEATCLGAAILAATAVGWYADVRAASGAMTGVGERFVPQLKAQAVYDQLYHEVYKPLFPALQQVVGRLTELT